MSWMRAAREDHDKLATDVAADRAWHELERERLTDAAAARVRDARKPNLPAAWELADEPRALRSTRPRSCRWRELEKIDAQLDALDCKREDALERHRQAEEALTLAPQRDAEALAAWIAAGENGDPPEPTQGQRRLERDATQILVDGIVVEIDRQLACRVEHVGRNRKKMAADAARDVQAVQARWLEAVRSLPGIREELLAARATEIWARCFPDPSAMSQPGFTPRLALGLRAPIERTLGLKVQLDFIAVVAALEADARTIATLLTAEQADAAGVPNENATPEDIAMWDDDPRRKEWAQRKTEELRELGRFGGLNHDALAGELPR